MAITIDGADNKLEIGANATGPSSLRLYEDTDNGTNYVSIIAPSAVTSNRTLTLPDNTGTVVTDSATQTLTNKTLGSGLVVGASLITSGTSVASTSGTSIDFTGIPSWVKRITVMFNGVSWNNTVGPLVQLGDSGGVETTGYSTIAGNSSTASTASAGASTAGFGFQAGWDATTLFSGSLILSLLDVSTNTWVGQGILYADSSTTDYAVSASGVKSLSATLDRVRVTSTAAVTFDAGSINILFE
jgi:hypothetical protein